MLLVLTSAVPAAQADNPSPTPHNTALIAHTYDLRAVTSDPQHTATVSTAGGAVDVTVNANIAFAKDSAELTAAARQRLGQLATQLRATGPGTLQVVGYTDNLGSHAHGLELSRQRAKAVSEALGKVPGKTLVVKGMAEADPVAPNTTEQGRAQNRRVEIHYRPA
ncbi:MAG: OmpA family protein [Luteococcus sp.]|nr:OmpA family protein [Luteococcus sp.]